MVAGREGSREWWRRVKDYSVKHNITFDEAKRRGAGRGGNGRRKYPGKPPTLEKPFIVGGKEVKSKFVCVSCGKEAKTAKQQYCSYCKQHIIEKVVVDKEVE